jgi:hypothetical protein
LQTTWDAAQRTGSRGIFVWESTDLVHWKNERLVQVEDKTAGMVWAPEAIWDATKGQYLVHWASKFYAASDTSHTGTPSNTKIRFACKQSSSHMCQTSLAKRGLMRVVKYLTRITRAHSKTIAVCTREHTNSVHRHQRLQDFQRTSDLHRQGTNRHNRPHHPAVRKHPARCLPPLPQG